MPNLFFLPSLSALQESRDKLATQLAQDCEDEQPGAAIMLLFNAYIAQRVRAVYPVEYFRGGDADEGYEGCSMSATSEETCYIRYASKQGLELMLVRDENETASPQFKISWYDPIGELERELIDPSLLDFIAFVLTGEFAE